MEYEWDEEKRRINRAKHGIDFELARTIWDGQVIDPSDDSVVAGEMRRTALGMTAEGEIIIAVIYTVGMGHGALSARDGRGGMNAKITRRSSGEAVEGDLTDWDRVRALTDEDIEAAIANDPEASLGLDGSRSAVRGVIFKDKEGAWRWRLIGANGEAIADSPKSYTDRSEVDRAINTLRAAIIAADVQSKAA